MKTIALYSAKGGVGKSTLAVALAWCSSQQSCRNTLLWDLDAQGAATYLLSATPDRRARMHAVFDRKIAPDALISATDWPHLSVLPADLSLHGLDSFFHRLDRKKRLRRVLADLDQRFDRVILDCPPGLTDMSEQIFRAADVLIIPLIPSPLARRALETARRHLAETFKGHPPILPVFSMVDRRRRLHRDAIAADPDWPVIPMSSVLERLSECRAPLSAGDRRGAAGQSIQNLWAGIERKLAALE